ncbi:helix-turn-helix domain-containing protein [Streptosporangium sp. NPDC023615]|uniref:helix-turn-helix domain-containing protein n=1 Tax=Streptosporangium sp. NPDC023615 TaxID=3154794 RepID=UPI00342FB45D
MAGQGTIGDRIRGLRVNKHMSQAQLAGQDLSDSYVSLIESGKRTPTPVVTRLLADRLGCTVEFLLHGIEPHQRVDTGLALRHAELELLHGDPALASSGFAAVVRAVDHDGAALSAQARFGQARALEAQGRTAEAVEAYERLRGEAATHPERLADLPVVVALCRCYHRAGDTLRARDLGTEALAQVTRLGLDRGDLALDLAEVLAETEIDLAYVERVLAASGTPAAGSRPEVLELWRASVALAGEDSMLAVVLAEDALAAGRPARTATRYVSAATRWAWLVAARPGGAGLARAAEFAASAAEVLARLSPETAEHARGLIVLSRVRLRAGGMNAVDGAEGTTGAGRTDRAGAADPVDGAAALVERALGMLAGARGTVPAMASVTLAEIALARSKDAAPALAEAERLLTDAAEPVGAAEITTSTASEDSSEAVNAAASAGSAEAAEPSAGPAAGAAPVASAVDRESARLWREIGDLWGRAGSPERQRNAYLRALKVIGVAARPELSPVSARYAASGPAIPVRLGAAAEPGAR